MRKSKDHTKMSMDTMLSSYSVQIERSLELLRSSFALAIETPADLLKMLSSKNGKKIPKELKKEIVEAYRTAGREAHNASLETLKNITKNMERAAELQRILEKRPAVREKLLLDFLLKADFFDGTDQGNKFERLAPVYDRMARASQKVTAYLVEKNPGIIPS